MLAGWLDAADPMWNVEGGERGLSALGAWVFSLEDKANFLDLQVSLGLVYQSLGGLVLFYFFAACCVIGLGTVFLFTPETQRVSLEDMELRLHQGVRPKQIGA